jgi:acyl-CoA synthetase (NDP forming)
MFDKNQSILNKFMSEELNEMVGDLLSQLNDAQTKAKELEKEQNPLKKEELEKFVVEKGGKLVDESIEMLKNVKDYILSSPEAKDVDAFASLVAATSTAIDTLNKIVVVDKKSETVVKVKKMDIEAKKEMQQEENNVKLLATREQVFKALIDNAKVIDTESEQIKD